MCSSSLRSCRLSYLVTCWPFLNTVSYLYLRCAGTSVNQGLLKHHQVTQICLFLQVSTQLDMPRSASEIKLPGLFYVVFRRMVFLSPWSKTLFIRPYEVRPFYNFFLQSEVFHLLLKNWRISTAELQCGPSVLRRVMIADLNHRCHLWYHDHPWGLSSPCFLEMSRISSSSLYYIIQVVCIFSFLLQSLEIHAVEDQDNRL